MNRIKCKDYYIIKICYYADKYLNNRFDDNYQNKVSKDPAVIKQHLERTGLYHKFKCEYIEYITGKDLKSWMSEYSYEPFECAFEEIYEKYGIISAICTEGWYYYFIPKTLPDVLEWMTSNLVNPFKIISKTNHIPMIQNDLSWMRRFSLDLTNNIKDNYSELKTKKYEK